MDVQLTPELHGSRPQIAQTTSPTVVGRLTIRDFSGA